MRVLRTVPFVVAALVLSSSAALAQTTPNPTVTPEPIGGWTIWQGWGAIVLGILLVGAVVVGYLRYAPHFYATEERPKPRRQLPPGARTAASLAIPREGSGGGESRE